MTRLLSISLLALVAAGLLGQFPQGHPLVGALHVTLPSLHAQTPSTQTTTATPATSTTSHRGATVHVSKFATKGATVVLRGVAPAAGKVVVRGSYSGKRWQTLATLHVAHVARAWKAPVHLARQGKLHLRIVYPDGSLAVGSIQVALQMTLHSLHAKTAPAKKTVPVKKAAPAKKTAAPRPATPKTSHPVRHLRVPYFAVQGVSISLHGIAPTAGKVVVRGSYGGKRWSTLATTHAAHSWRAPVYLQRRGTLHLRVLYPDGSRAVGSIEVV